MNRVKRKIIRRQCGNDLSHGTLDPLLQRLYGNRGITSEKHLQYGLANLPDPNLLKSMSIACDLLYDALITQAKILIVGDYDVDGACSTAVAMLGLRSFGFENVAYFIPDRVELGYGLTPEIVELVCEFQPDVIITVDNGISSHDGVIAARELGISVIVTDHHLPDQFLPEADCIINPNQQGDKFPSKCIAGVGVIFYLMIGLRTGLRERGWFKENNIREPKLTDLLDLVALGTIADIVAFDYVNRILVEQGLRRIRSDSIRPGLIALFNISSRDHRVTTTADIAYAVAPRLNAAGRLEDMAIGVECLLSTDSNQAKQFAEKLESINNQRREQEGIMHKQAKEMLENINIKQSDNSDSSSICLFNENWHPGIVGLIASRCKEIFNKPSIIFCSDGENLKGSARSVKNLNIRDLLHEIDTANPSLLISYGGHAMAAGLSLTKESFSHFSQVFENLVKLKRKDDTKHVEILSDGELAANQLTVENALLIESAGPWGAQFEEPVFDDVFWVQDKKQLGKENQHLKLSLTKDRGSQDSKQAILFNAEKYIPSETLQASFKRVHAIYRLNVNRYNGKNSLTLIIDYLSIL